MVHLGLGEGAPQGLGRAQLHMELDQAGRIVELLQESTLACHQPFGGSAISTQHRLTREGDQDRDERRRRLYSFTEREGLQQIVRQLLRGLALGELQGNAQGQPQGQFLGRTCSACRQGGEQVQPLAAMRRCHRIGMAAERLLRRILLILCRPPSVLSVLKVQRQLSGHLSRPAAVARFEPFRHKTMPPRPLGHPELLIEHVAIHDVAKRVAHRCCAVGPRQDILRHNAGSLPGDLVTYRFHVLHGLLQHSGDCRGSEVKPTYTRGLDYLLCCGAKTFELLQQ